MLLLSDPHTVFIGVQGVEFRRKRFVSRGLSIIDVKHVKNALDCAINDVLLGVASAALSRYYFRKLGGDAAKKGCVCVRSCMLVLEFCWKHTGSSKCPERNYLFMGDYVSSTPACCSEKVEI
ncbi:hypothetical protein PR202_gb29264 [Eleusine coracana subsp. coracana]|uniref:Diacylglycerol O-acyltransferase n=1 Tax=Eleusine coracana subsp. coracana TaxID=191504 RepID=A0AAV5G0W3_ELECO|nr:hypothetical protein PR202_gb29264 [Eleusine coracana subsp. coracana]